MAAKKKFSWMKFVVIFVIVFVVVGGIWHFFSPKTEAPDTSMQQVQIDAPQGEVILGDVATWIPDAGWSNPAPASETTMYGDLSGYATSGTVTSQQASLDHFEMMPELEQLGFTADTNLAASGPGSDVWGYKRMVDGGEQVLILSYTTQPTSSNPNEPLQFNCPCQIQVKGFVSNPFTPTDQQTSTSY